MATVAAVFRSGGGVYDERWVRALAEGIDLWAGDARFICLSDVQIDGIDTAPLDRDWPGWWAKMELFRPGLFGGPVLYMDLDTLPVGRLDDLLFYSGDFAMISDFYRPHLAQSGVMAWTPGARTDEIWRAFEDDPQKAMSGFRGDGEFIRDAAHDADRLQDLYPGHIVSYKVHATDGPGAARLVCGHGDPRFSSPSAGWAHDLWSERTP